MVFSGGLVASTTDRRANYSRKIMATSGLMYIGDPKVFSFDHAMNHRPWIGVWGPERQSYSTIPYLLGRFYKDPLHDEPQWRLWHQTAHWDTVYRPSNPAGPFSTPVGQPLWLSGPSEPNQTKWWLFMNWQEHVLVEANQAQNQNDFYYPYW
jgi:hypothetical protein